MQNELRKGLYYNYDYYRQFHNDTLVSPQFRIWHSSESPSSSLSALGMRMMMMGR